MKTLLLCLLTPLFTFSLGMGVDRVFSQRPIEAAPTVVKTREEVTPEAAPAATAIETPILPTPGLTLVLDNPTKILGNYAAFSIIGPKPREFPYFDFIEVALSVEGLPDFISVYESTSETSYEYHTSFAVVTNRKLFFVTSQTDSGFEYRFDGEFVRTDFERISGKKEVALRGTLTKTKDGQTVAERFVNLDMNYLGCN